MKYILTGGGSGGHIYPALAIGGKIKKEEPEAEFLYIGTKDRLEAQIVPAKGYKIKFISAAGLPASKFGPAFLVFVIKMLLGILKSAFIIIIYKPDMIIGTGGFVSAPVVFAGAMLKKLKLSKTVIFLHEANSEPGKMIKLMGRFCDGVGTAYRSCLKYFPDKGRYVGFPVRSVFFTGNREEARKKLGIPNNAFVVFSVGGSQGARTINRAVVDALPHLKELKNLYFIHGTGKSTKNYDAEGDTLNRFQYNGIAKEDFPFYQNYSYLDNIENYYFAADLVITRGGAGSLYEIAVCGRASIIIPKANLSGDHQVMNAENMKSMNASEIVYEEVLLKKNKFEIEVPGEKLAQSVITLYNKKSKIEEMERNSNKIVKNISSDDIYSFVKEIASGRIEKIPSVNTEENENVYAKLSSSALVSKLSRISKKEILVSKNLNYIRYKASHYFTSPVWQIRNNAVKITGLTYDEERVSYLSRLFNNREKVSLTKRLLGGDFVQVGFIRRNIMIAYRQIGVYSSIIENDIILGLTDSYYETRCEALRNVTFFAKDLKHREEIKKLVMSNFKSFNFDIVRESILAYTEFVENFEDFLELKRFYLNVNWKIREAVIISLTKLKGKKIITDKEQIKSVVDNIILSSTGFLPEFNLKKTLKKLMEE